RLQVGAGGKVVLSAADNVKVWDATAPQGPRTLSTLSERLFLSWGTGASSIHFTADGQHLLLGDVLGRRLKQLDLARGQERVLWKNDQAAGHSWVFSPDGKRAAGVFNRRPGGDDGGGEVQLWDTAADRLLARWPGRGPLALSPDGRAFVW